MRRIVRMVRDRSSASQKARGNGANMGPTWVLSAPDGPHVGPMNLAIRVQLEHIILVKLTSYIVKTF